MKRVLLALTLVLVSALCINAQEVVLANNRVKLEFDKEGNECIFSSFTVDGKELLPVKGTKTSIWELTLKGKYGEFPTLTTRNAIFSGARLSEDGKSATLIWRIVVGGEDRCPVYVTVSLPDEDSVLPVWTIKADLPRGWMVHELEFPRINIARIKDLKAMLPVGYGAEYPIANTGFLTSHYPSCSGVMQFIMAHNGKETYYMCTQDKQACTKDLKIQAEGKTLTFMVKTPTSYAWTTPTGHFELPFGTVFGYRPDNWDKAVMEWYRPFALSTEWGSKNLKERRVVDWVEDTDIWVRPMGVTPSIEKCIGTAYQTFGEGIGLHWYFWHKHRFDTNYPEYFPAQEGFEKMVKNVQSKYICHVTPYINGRLWDTANHTYEEKQGFAASCRRLDNTLYTEVYSSRVINTVTCPGSDIWRNILKETCKTLIKDYKTDGVYMDQVGCAVSQPCYATNHNHPQGGGGWWPAAYRSLIKDMRKDFVGANKALTTEECAEPYVDLFDMLLIVNGPHTSQVHMVPAFPMVYSDRAIYCGFTYLPSKLNDGGFRFTQMKSLLWGAQLGWVDVELLFNDMNKNEVKFLKNLVEFRKKNHDVFVGGRFIEEFEPVGEDNPVISVPAYQKTKVVMGAKWISTTGKKVTILVNMSTEDHKVVLENGKTIKVNALSAVRI